VAGVLHDLTESGLVFRTGSGDAASYRAANEEELGTLTKSEDAEGLDEMVWAIIYREGPLRHETLSKLVRDDRLAEVLERLKSRGTIKVRAQGGDQQYAAEELFIAQHAAVGWEAAVFDHFQAMARTIAARLASRASGSVEDQIGGSTYSFDVWPGHPNEQEALGHLARFREHTSDLRARIRRHNEAHPRPKRVSSVTVYGGQVVVGSDEDEENADI
jgi:hypothetical protein